MSRSTPEGRTPESAVKQAKAAAAGKSVGVHGADTIQQCLKAGLLDEFPERLMRSPRPLGHASTRQSLKELREQYRGFVAA